MIGLGELVIESFDTVLLCQSFSSWWSLPLPLGEEEEGNNQFETRRERENDFLGTREVRMGACGDWRIRGRGGGGGRGVLREEC